MTMLIGLVGFIGSGKGTVADILMRNHNFEKLSFADSVKDSCASIFGWPRHLLEGDTTESREFRECRDPFWSKKFGRDFTPREALQLMGTEAGRDVFHKDLWIYTVERKLSNLTDIPVVIPDVRFPNEIKFIKKLGGHIVRVKRGDDPEWYSTAYSQNTGMPKEHGSMESMYPNVHPSEWSWVGSWPDWILYNERDLWELETNVNYCLTALKDPVRITA